jgi:hypothetical protein
MANTTITDLSARINLIITEVTAKSITGNRLGNILLDFLDTVSELLDEKLVTSDIAHKVNISDIVNNLTTAVAGKVLDARAGKTLATAINDVNAALGNIWLWATEFVLRDGNSWAANNSPFDKGLYLMEAYFKETFIGSTFINGGGGNAADFGSGRISDVALTFILTDGSFASVSFSTKADAAGAMRVATNGSQSPSDFILRFRVIV